MARKKSRAQLREERAQRREEREEDIRAQVLNQPHRNKNEDQRCGDAFGRYCVKHGLPPAVYDAGQRYAHMVIRWRTLVGVPVNIDARVDHFVAMPLSPEELCIMKDTLRHQIDKIERKIINSVGREALDQMRAMLFDELDVSDNDDLRVGLSVLAHQLGYFRTKVHPFK